MLQPSHFTPNTGLASLADASPDYELAPIGLASFQDQAKKLAEYGRNGDIYVVHAAEGETVVPMEVLNENPKIKELLFKQMEDMGLDPQEFVVGNQLNSINPVTGLPEFFFKKVFRSVKRAVKSVAKVVKKAAPIVLPIAAAAFGVPFLGPSFGAGTFGASFLGSGIGTLVGGGSFKDALKSGLISGGLSVASSGIGALARGTDVGAALQGTFTGATPVFDAAGTQIGTQYAASPFADALGGSQARIASAAASREQFKNLLGGDITGAFTEEGTLFGPKPTGQAPGFVPVTQPTAATTPILNPNAAAIQSGIDRAQAAGMPPGAYQVAQATGSGQPLVGASTTTTQNPLGFTPGQTTVTAGQQSAIDSAAKQAMDKAATDASYFKLGVDNKLLGGPSITSADILKANPNLGSAPSAALEAAAEKLNPSLLRQAAVPLALGAGAAALGGAFDTPEIEEPTKEDLEGFVEDLGPTGFELFQQDPERFKVTDISPTQFVPSGTPLIPTTFPALQAAEGGMAEFPRREMLVEGPGTETSDDIPAMLSDGEFVMNARAVRGADPSGNGDRYAGAKNLYNMMRNFEMRA